MNGTVAGHLTACVARAAVAAGLLEEGAAVESVVPIRDAKQRETTQADYQSNLAFRLTKAARLPPAAIAAALLAAMPDDEAIAAVTVAGKGFVNFRLSDAWLAADALSRAKDDRLRTPATGDGHTLVLDYSSPNVAKRMHVGHMRSTVIGAAIDRLFRFLGWRVIADNHLGDWGTPYGKLLVGWHAWRDDAAYADDPVGELQRLYQKATTECEKDAALMDEARAHTVALQRKEPATLALWQQFVDVTLAEFMGIYERLQCRFDVFLGESAYAGDLQPLVEELLASGIAEVSEGAVIVPFDESDGKGLKDQPLLIRKADGAALYSTTDLATIRHRVATWSPSHIVYVVDTRQQHHFRQAFAAARKMGIAEVTLHHLWFGMLRFADGTVAAARSGAAINLVDVLDTAAAKAFDVVTEKNPALPEAERRQIAEHIAVGTIKYFDLSQNPQTDITFDWDKALSLDGGSAVYLMYAYARLHSILRNGEVSEKVPTTLPAVAHPTERTLALLVAMTPEIAQNAADAYRPNVLADHIESLAQAVGPFYEHCPVLKDGVDPAVREARLSLVFTVARTLEIGLSLLGITVVPRM